jgi:diadenosine hexaphosphate hydrolase (ATP-forming)
VSAAGLVVNPNGDVLIVQQKGGSFSLPKGKPKEGEDALNAAVREIGEEAGVTDLVYELDLCAYMRSNLVNPLETVTILLMMFSTNETTATAVNDPDLVTKSEGAWFLPVETVIEKLSHPVDKKKVRDAIPEIERLIKLRSAEGVTGL